MGWPNTEAEDFKTFFPTNTLVTGYDIIQAWVSHILQHYACSLLFLINILLFLIFLLSNFLLHIYPCPHIISDAEIEYKEETSHLWHVKYPIVGEDGFIVVATTRPETMLG